MKPLFLTETLRHYLITFLVCVAAVLSVITVTGAERYRCRSQFVPGTCGGNYQCGPDIHNTAEVMLMYCVRVCVCVCGCFFFLFFRGLGGGAVAVFFLLAGKGKRKRFDT